MLLYLMMTISLVGTPIESKNNVESMGLAVFRGDKLVGELNNIETLCHLIITNDLKNATINITNPFEPSTNISLYISLSKETKRKVSLVNNYPFIECEIWLTGNIPTIYSSIDLSNEACMDTLNEALCDNIEAHVLSYLYKTAKEYKTDIASFGRLGLKDYLTWQDWVDSNWASNYQNSFFSVNVNSTIQSGQLFTKI